MLETLQYTSLLCIVDDLLYLLNKVGSYITYNFRFSALFPDVVNCMQTDNLELKKLVYLYLMNYAKSQPDTAIMAVNTFVRVRIVIPPDLLCLSF